MEFEKLQAEKEAVVKQLSIEAKANALRYGNKNTTGEPDPAMIAQTLVLLETEYNRF